MPTFGHIFQVMFKAEGDAGVVRNVFHYIPDEAVLNGNDAAKALGDEVAGASLLGFVAAVVSSEYTFTQVRVTDLADTDTLYDLTVNVPGGSGGDTLPPNVAVTFTSAQPAVGVHRASKRFGPLVEAYNTDKGVIISTAGTDLGNLKDALNGVISTDDAGLFVSDWHLALVKRIKVAGPPVSYHLPEPGDFPATAYFTTGWDWNPVLTTQNTRIKGRGE